MSNYQIIPCVQGTKEWLDIRKSGIGSSDAAAAIGLGKWKSKLELYREKTNKEHIYFDNWDMAKGRALEPVIRDWYAKHKGREIEPMNAILRSVEHPFMLASLDAAPTNSLLEIKTYRSREGWGEAGTDQIPQEYLLQVQHSLIVTGLPRAEIAVSFFGGEPELYEVHADQDLQQTIIELERQFWEMVENNIEPEAESLDDAKIKYAKSTPEKSAWMLGGASAISELKSFNEEVKRLSARADGLKLEIQNSMQDAEVLVDETDQSIILATWKSDKPPETFDTEAFKAAHPELYKQFIKIGDPIRRFLIK